ncbi:MAG: T9SS type A sorting domain-containing protein [Saprospiraceae bacterium]
MNKKHLFIFLFFSPFFCNSQQISFEASVALFDHPSSPYAGFSNPFIPFDYNSDGLVDFIGATFNDQYVYKGIASDQFEQIDIYQGFSHKPLKVMDFDNDGDMDVIMERYINLYESADSFTFFNPNINFQEDIVEVADFDNNGLNDLLTHKSITFANDELIIHYGQVGGGFMSEVIYSEFDYGDVEVADIDGNGDLDILVMLEFATNEAVILSNSDTTFTPAFIPLFFNSSHTTAKLADLDGDLDLDLIALGSFDDVYIVENTDNFVTANSFQQLQLIDADFLSIADMDLDGDIDIIVSANNSSNSTLFSIENKGALNFDAALEIEMFGEPNSTTSGSPNYVSNNLNLYDFDGDGKKDLIYVDGRHSNQVVYYKNISTITDINNVTSKDDFIISVFPNPVNDRLKIEVENIDDFSNYEIFTVSGKKMKEEKLDGAFINVSSLQPGIYFLSLDQSNSIRFIKQ